MSEFFFRRRLPHFQPDNATFFVTFRLAGSLPRNVLERFKAEQVEAKKRIAQLAREGKTDLFKQARAEQESRYFGRFDAWLDRSTSGDRWLSNPRIAQAVYDAILIRDGHQYELICFTIMPNHVHMVFTLTDAQLKRPQNRRVSSKYILSPLLESLKRYTAGQANKILERTGQFWQHESYDHVVRDQKELRRIIRYVMNNPLKAGLVKVAEDWKWSYLKEFA